MPWIDIIFACTGAVTIGTALGLAIGWGVERLIFPKDDAQA